MPSTTPRPRAKKFERNVIRRRLRKIVHGRKIDECKHDLEKAKKNVENAFSNWMQSCERLDKDSLKHCFPEDQIAVVKQMRDYPDNVVILKLGCKHLAMVAIDLDNDDDDIPGVLLKLGALEQAMVAMKHKSHDLTLIGLGIGLVGALLSNEEAAKIVIRQGGLKDVADVMENHQRNDMIQRFGCSAFHVLLTNCGQWSTTAAGQIRIGRLVNRAMTFGDRDVHLLGCKILYLMSMGTQAGKDSIEAGVLVPLLSFLSLYPDDSEMLDWACKTARALKPRSL